MAFLRSRAVNRVIQKRFLKVEARTVCQETIRVFSPRIHFHES